MEADLFISHLTQDALEPHFRPVIEASVSGSVDLLASSEVWDDIISALRSQKVPITTVRNFLADAKAVPHRTLPVTLEIATSAMDLYENHGGSRRLHYFDSFHVSTSLFEKIPLLTSDKYILSHAGEMGIRAIDVRKI